MDTDYKMCLFPQNAKLNDLGRLKFDHEGDLKIPCGKCNECISKRAIEWSTRARHEISMHNNNCFLTLTYNEDKLPSIYVVKEEFQKFMKRLRKHTKQKLRYMVSHEYGSKTFRPHHHAIIFGYNPKNQKNLLTSKSGEPLFISDEIEKLWTNGFHSIGSANEKTAYYIASYSLKGKKHTFPDPNTGEIINVSDSMDCSKRPAIGYQYLQENYKQLVQSQSILPRYYFKKLKDLDEELFEFYENDRITKFLNRSSHELYAKQIIDISKNNVKNHFRETTEIQEIETKNLSEQLLINRDNYVTYLERVSK